jgi:hypothetical protein
MAASGRRSGGGGRGEGEREIAEVIRARDNVACIAIERQLAKLGDAAACLIQQVAGSEDTRFPGSILIRSQDSLPLLVNHD